MYVSVHGPPILGFPFTWYGLRYLARRAPSDAPYRTILSPPSRWRSCRCWRGWSWLGSSRGKALTDFGTMRVASPASVPETDTAIRLRAAGGSSRRAPGPWHGLDPAWPSTWIEHAASLDSAYPQPDGEHIVTWLPSTD